MTASTAAKTSSMRRGLARYSSMPAARQRSRSPFMAWAVMATIGTCAPVPRLALADRGGRLEAVHLGHLHVHQHQVERPRAPAPSTASRPLPTTVTAWPVLLEHADRQLLVDRVVLGQRGPAAAAPAAAAAASGGRRAAAPAGAPPSEPSRMASQQIGLLDRLGEVARRPPSSRQRPRRRGCRPTCSISTGRRASAGPR